MCITKKETTSEKKYANYEACSVCPNKKRCTTSKTGRVITRKENEEYVEIVNTRTIANKGKYSQRQAIVEHVFGSVKRSMNFTHFLLRGFKKVSCEVSMVFFSYNLKRTIKVLGFDRLLGLLTNAKIRKAATT